jgi:hypothetical protein
MQLHNYGTVSGSDYMRCESLAQQCVSLLDIRDLVRCWMPEWDDIRLVEETRLRIAQELRSYSDVERNLVEDTLSNPSAELTGMLRGFMNRIKFGQQPIRRVDWYTT